MISTKPNEVSETYLPQTLQLYFIIVCGVVALLLITHNIQGRRSRHSQTPVTRWYLLPIYSSGVANLVLYSQLLSLITLSIDLGVPNNDSHDLQHLHNYAIIAEKGVVSVAEFFLLQKSSGVKALRRARLVGLLVFLIDAGAYTMCFVFNNNKELWTIAGTNMFEVVLHSGFFIYAACKKLPWHLLLLYFGCASVNALHLVATLLHLITGTDEWSILLYIYFYICAPLYPLLTLFAIWKDSMEWRTFIKNLGRRMLKSQGSFSSMNPGQIRLVDPAIIKRHQKIFSGIGEKNYMASINGEVVGIMKVLCYKLIREEIVEFVRETVKCQGCLYHPHLLQLQGISLNPPYIELIYEWCSLGSVKDYLISRKTPLRIDEKVQILKEVASALCYLHSHWVLHRDLKCANILLSKVKNQKGVNTIVAKLIDFGTSRRIEVLVKSPDRDSFSVEKRRSVFFTESRKRGKTAGSNKRLNSSYRKSRASTAPESPDWNEEKSDNIQIQVKNQQDERRVSGKKSRKSIDEIYGEKLLDSTQKNLEGSRKKHKKNRSRKISMRTQHYLESFRYMSPEVLNAMNEDPNALTDNRQSLDMVYDSTAYESSSDIYSLGIVMYEIFDEKLYCDEVDIGDLIDWVLSGGKPKLSREKVTPLELRELMNRCLSQDLLRRPSAEIVYQSLTTWLTENGFNK